MKIIRLIPVLVLFFVTAFAARADDWKPDDDFTSLFNGQDLTGWHYKMEADLAGKFLEPWSESDERSAVAE